MQIIEKNKGPRTVCFLDPGATSAIEIGGEKGDQKKDRPKLAYHYFSRARMLRTSIFLKENTGTHVSANLSFGHPFHRQFL